MKHVMVDLETLSSRHDAAIISIGAVKFDFASGTMSDPYYVNVKPDDRFHISGDTVMWWMSQSPAAIAALVKGERLSLPDALNDFAKWFPKGACLWGNGATFDNVILRNAYNVCGIRPPWHYRDDRCFRTMKAMLPVVEWPHGGVAHNALDDAEAQAQYIMNAWRAK